MIHYLALYLATFYVFNMQYPKEMAGTVRFFQKFVLKIKDDSKTHAKLLTLISRLKKAKIGSH